MPSRPLTPEQKQDARRLKALFDKWRKTYADKDGKLEPIESLAERAGHKQSAFSQRLNGTMALNAKAAIQFAELLECQVSDFSPSLAAEIASYSQVNIGELPKIPEGRKDNPLWARDLTDTQARLVALCMDNAKNLPDEMAEAIITLIKPWIDEPPMPKVRKRTRLKV